jgi:hypothetical protein
MSAANAPEWTVDEGTWSELCNVVIKCGEEEGPSGLELSAVSFAAAWRELDALPTDPVLRRMGRDVYDSALRFMQRLAREEEQS